MRSVHFTSVRCASLVFIALVWVYGASACGLIAGLPDYAAGLEDAGPHGPSHAPSPEASGTAGDDVAATGADEGDDALEDQGEGTGAADDAGDADDVADAGPSEIGDGADVGPDAAAVCRSECGGCCDPEGVCHGGQSLATCGSGGEVCVDCSSSGKTCSSAGACVMPTQVEAGPPPMCNALNCTNKCPLLEAPCCKQDQTCGCAVLGLLLCN